MFVRSGDSVTYVAIWVDNIIVRGIQADKVERFQTDMGTRFKITECRPLFNPSIAMYLYFVQHFVYIVECQFSVYTGHI